MTEKYVGEASTGATSQLESDRSKGLRLAPFVPCFFFPTVEAAAYNAVNLPSLADAVSSLLLLSKSDVASCIWLTCKVRQRWQWQSCLCLWNTPSGDWIPCCCSPAPCNGCCGSHCHLLGDVHCERSMLLHVSPPISFGWLGSRHTPPMCA